MFKTKQGWKRVKEVYALENDQGMKNIENFVAPCGETVSVFLVDEKPAEGLLLFDKMLRDYKKITPNLALLFRAKLKIKEKFAEVYVLRENFSKKEMVQMFFEHENRLYALIFNLKKYFPDIKKIMSENPVFRETLMFLEEQE